jgi:homogentisate phytyltransferase/homogentisate geranylgeranyltransferase
MTRSPSASSAPSAPRVSPPPPGLLRSLLEFTRPHTIVGTTLAVWVLYIVAAADAHRQSLSTALLAYVASLAVNVYIVGLNQLTDVEIDRINKPYLPLAAGTLSRSAATAIVAGSGATALLVAAAAGRYLFATIAIVFVIGSLYSLPPVRLKRSPLLAAAAITVARALVGNVGVYLTYSARLTGTASLPPHVLLFVSFMLGFVVVIAVMKDIPDIDGDRRHQISTFVSRLGARRTLLVCHVILTTCYLATIVVALAGVSHVHRGVLVGAHALALTLLWVRALRLDPDDRQAVVLHYMFIWKLFYLEFAAFPIACLLA